MNILQRPNAHEYNISHLLLAYFSQLDKLTVFDNGNGDICAISLNPGQGKARKPRE